MNSKICLGCGYVITCKYLSLNGEDWHSSCILCDECEAPVFAGETTDKFHSQDGKIYCKDCVTQLFQVCADCGQPAKKYVKALGKIWHTFHFKCASCKQILDSYAEVDGAAYCQPCHQRMSAKTFTRAKRRSFGTEKREQAAKDAASRPAWAQKPRPIGAPNPNAPKSALDVMHKSWFVNGLKKPASPTPSSVPAVAVPPSSNGGGSGSSSPSSPRSASPSPGSNGTSSPTRSYSPSPSNNYAPAPSPLSPKPAPISKPRGYIPPLSSPAPKPSWVKPVAQTPQEPPKQNWGAAKPQATATPPFSKANLKPAAGSQLGNSGGTRSGPPGGAGSNGYTAINFSNNITSAKANAVNRALATPSPPPQGSSNVADILEAIFRPLSEDEVGSLAFQTIPLLASVHTQGKLHNNIKHKTIFINPAGIVTLVDNDGEDESKVGGNSIKFKAPEAAITVSSDIYSLGVALWTSADYLLDEEEEPALSADFCDFIGLMTDDEPANRPPLKSLLPCVERYKDISAPLLAALIREVERKKLLRKEIHETTLQKQKSLGKVLLQEIAQGVRLKHVDVNALTPALKQTNPHELVCLYIKSFSPAKLRKVDVSKLPQKQFKMNPRERLMQSVLSGAQLKRALVVAGFDINALIAPVPNHPTYGTIFRDISGLFTIPKVSSQIAQQICQRFTGDPPDLFVATPTDAGVFFASLVGEFFNRGVIVLQNAGRLPRKMEKFSCGYETLGYVSHSLELQLQKNLVKENTRVVLIDEMLVNGSILEAARLILRETGARIKEVICIAELEGFGGRAKIRSFECNVHAMYTFNDNQQEQHR